MAESLEVIQQTTSVILAAFEPPVGDEMTHEELAEVAILHSFYTAENGFMPKFLIRSG